MRDRRDLLTSSMLIRGRLWYLLAVGLGAALLVAACGATDPERRLASGPASISHATGATEVVLRLDEGGAATSPTFLAIQPPTFTLYGDGAVIFRDVSHGTTPVGGGVVSPLPLFQIARLSEAGIQTLLAHALVAGGLGTARPEYLDARIADVPLAVFTVNAGGLSRSVTIDGLDIPVSDGPDVSARRALASLAQRLRDLDGDGTVRSQPYAPSSYRATLLAYPGGEPAPFGAIRWPWADLAPSDFVAGGGSGGDPTHVLTDPQAAALGVEGYPGGFQGLPMLGPGDGTVYGLQLRPLLPDDQ